MANHNTSQLVTQIWEQVMVESPDPFRNPNFLYGSQFSYRDKLDYQPVNYHGDTIPRIVTVRRNLRLLGKPTRKPRIPD